MAVPVVVVSVASLGKPAAIVAGTVILSPTIPKRLRESVVAAIVEWSRRRESTSKETNRR